MIKHYKDERAKKYEKEKKKVFHLVLLNHVLSFHHWSERGLSQALRFHFIYISVAIYGVWYDKRMLVEVIRDDGNNTSPMHAMSTQTTNDDKAHNRRIVTHY